MSNTAFRDYATRVSFSISLTRNQIYTLWQIAQGTLDINERATKREIFNLTGPDMFVPGSKWLQSHGFIIYTDPTTMTPKWSKFPWRLTPAGEHVLALLQIAGLIPQRAINENAPKRQTRRRA